MRVRRYRNTPSEGMLCSLVELGWADSGADEVAILRRGVIGEVLPYEGDLAFWLSDESYRRHIDFFLAGAEKSVDTVELSPAVDVSPATAPMPELHMVFTGIDVNRPQLADAGGVHRWGAEQPVVT
ncbi:hypothetical protein GCM10023203_41850 [Actinomycetospora straminea]|uniref:tRNA-binding domain-containing protein n=2 Tax=Actinomycetospora straminea TaxID=663607 RepID=A0ABP9EQT0_9PSEU